MQSQIVDRTAMRQQCDSGPAIEKAGLAQAQATAARPVPPIVVGEEATALDAASLFQALSKSRGISDREVQQSRKLIERHGHLLAEKGQDGKLLSRRLPIAPTGRATSALARRVACLYLGVHRRPPHACVPLCVAARPG